MRSIHLLWTLGATVVVGVPIKPRDFLDDLGGGGDVFGGLGNSIDDGGTFTASTINLDDLGGGGSFKFADNSFAGDLGLSGIEQFDLQPEIVATAPDPVTPDPNLYVDPQPQPQIVADVTPSLGATDGSLIASASIPPDTNQITPNSGITISFANNDPIPEFTPTDGSVIASIENLNPADIASSNSAPVTPDPVPIAVTPAPDSVTPPVTPVDDGLKIAGFVAPPVTLGADTALTPNLDVINTPIAFTPDQSITDVTASLPDLNTNPVQVASTEGSIGPVAGATPGISLQDFKTEANKYANDPSLKPEERQTWKDFGNVANQLTPEDFGKLTLDTKFTTPTKEADGSTVPGDKVGDLTPKGQTAVRQANFPNAYRTNNGFNFGTIATQGTSTLLNALIRLGSVFGEKALLNPQNQIYTLVQRVGVPVSVAVPVTLKVGVAVPVTVATTLPGGVVTKILIYRPNVAKATATGTNTKPNVVVAKATVTPKAGAPNAAKVKREAHESSDVEAPKEAQSPEYYVLPPPKNSDPEYYVEPEPKEWENTYGKEVVINPLVDSPYDEELDKPQWDKIASTFKYQPGDYSFELPHPPYGESEDAPYRTDEAAAPKEEPAPPKGSGSGSVDKVKTSP